MKERSKRILALMISVCMVVSVMPMTPLVVTAEENSGEFLVNASVENISDNALKMALIEDINVETIELQMSDLGIDDWYDSDELYEGYAAQLFSGDSGISPFGISAGASLDGVNKIAYDTLKSAVKGIADGEIDSSDIPLGDVFGDTFYSAEDLEVTKIVDETNHVTNETLAALCAKAGFDSREVITALLFDCPYEMYWYDKTIGCRMSIGFKTMGEKIRISDYTFSFIVDQKYRGSGLHDLDTEKTGAAKLAADNAKAILSEAIGKSNYEKIDLFRTKICELVDYNFDAASDLDEDGNGRADGDDYREANGLSAWQLVDVFDGDPDTKVVCEGYSKAFQYLCDMTTFSGTDVHAISVTGAMDGGGHMWNVMHMEDGRNYLVDITNCDSGTVGYPKNLFLTNYGGIEENGYKFYVSNDWITYIYDDDTLNSYSSEELALSAERYEEHSFPAEYTNGFKKCADVGCDLIIYEPATLENDIYHISNAGQLYWFSDLVNGKLSGIEQDLQANAVLDADVIVNASVLGAGGILNGTPEMIWIPIGKNSSDCQYSGIFDGQGHSVSGLYVEEAISFVGLFGCSNGTIKNVSVTDSYFLASSNIGGICGYNVGTISGCSNGASIVAGYYNLAAGGIAGRNVGKIDTCSNTGYIDGRGNDCIGGICGVSGLYYPSMNAVAASISNCINYGKVIDNSTRNAVGGICGQVTGPQGTWIRDRSTVTNCVNVGKVIVDGSTSYDISAGRLRAEYNNCYYFTDSKTSDEAKNLAQFKSGEVTYLLNEGKVDGTQIWYQKIGSDSYPTLKKSSDNIVYSYDACNGTDTFYTNDSTYDGITIDHTFTDGVCSVCNYDCAAHGHELNTAASIKVDETNHSFTCSACGKLGESKHDFLREDGESDSTKEACSLCAVKNINYQGLDSRINVANLVYTGSPQNPYIYIDGLEEGTDFTLESISKTDSADDYTVWLYGKGDYAGKRLVTWYISKTAASMITPGANLLSYTGAPLQLITPGSSSEGTILYSRTENGAYTETIPQETEAGNYVVWYKLIGDANHLDTEPVKIDAEIERKTITPIVDITGTYTYDGKEKTPTYTIKDGDTELAKADYTISLSNNVNAGTATITFKAAETGNYAFTDKSVNFTIEKAVPTYTQPNNLAATCHDMLSSVILPNGFSWADEDCVLEAGSTKVGQTITKKAKYTPEDTTNYEIVTDISLSISIAHNINVANKSDGVHEYACDKCSSYKEDEACTGGIATCKDKAVCNICKTAYGNKNANSHVGGTEIKNKKAASCVSTGYTGDTYCKGCGVKTKSGNSIATLGHSYNSGVVVSEPTHTSQGKKVYTCVRCNNTKTEIIPMLPEEPVPPVEVVQRQNIESFVSRMYTVVLSRAAEEEGKDYWSDELENCTYDGAALASGFVNSPEFKARGLNDEEYVEVLYATFFDREGDEGGKNYWLSEMANGMSRNEVLAGFVNSKEFGGICEDYGIARGTMEKDGSSIYNPGVRNFVLRNYTKALERDGELEGVEYWSHLINTKQSTALDAAESFFQSQEFKNKNLNDSDYVEVLYETFFGRASDEGGKSYWLSMLAQGSSRDWVLSEFSNSKEFSNIMSEYGL